MGIFLEVFYQDIVRHIERTGGKNNLPHLPVHFVWNISFAADSYPQVLLVLEL